MVREDTFNSISDLYKRVLPALNTRLAELKREKITYIDTIDIWNYCINNCWRNKKNLRIYELVSDILNVDSLELIMYVRKKLKNEESEINER